MPLLAGDIITGARDRHPAFDKQQTPDASALRSLSAYARELHGKVGMIDASILREEVVVPFPLADFSAGIELPDNRQVVELVGATAAYPNGTPIEIIPALTRNDLNAPASAAWQIGNRLYLRGSASDWRTLTSVAIAFVAVPAPLATLADEVMAMRGGIPERPAVDVAGFASLAQDAERQFLDDIVTGMGGRTFRTRDVWRP
jgi:hypothetical protein